MKAEKHLKNSFDFISNFTRLPNIKTKIKDNRLFTKIFTTTTTTDDIKAD